MTVPNTKKEAPIYGPHNPHPLSNMRAELVWDGKYDEYGNRRATDVAGLAMPMQRIETIDQPRAEALAADQFEMYEQRNRRQDDFRNRLIWGDNKLVLASLYAEFKGKIDLIYIDPPFDIGADFGTVSDIVGSLGCHTIKLIARWVFPKFPAKLPLLFASLVA